MNKTIVIRNGSDLIELIKRPWDALLVFVSFMAAVATLFIGFVVLCMTATIIGIFISIPTLFVLAI